MSLEAYYLMLEFLVLDQNLLIAKQKGQCISLVLIKFTEY